MPYFESYDEQNALLTERFEEVQSYLKKLADSADVARKKSWALPVGITLEDYPEHIKPLRVKVQKMFGYPPPGTLLNSKPVIKEIGQDEDGTFCRVFIPLLKEGYEAYGLLIKPSRPSVPQRKVLAVAIHGGGGTPELAAGILGSSNYNDMGKRLARRGYTVWMPACYERISFDEKYNRPDVHRVLDLKARLVGTTLSAIDAFGIIKSTEILLDSKESDKKEAIAVGLSYGGFRALLVSAFSDIFVACVSSCFFNDRRTELEKYGEKGTFTDWFFENTLSVATDVELCRLICPRPLFIEVGIKDDLFPVDGAIEASVEVRKLYEKLNVRERFGFDAFEGGHEFSGVKALEFLDRMSL